MHHNEKAARHRDVNDGGDRGKFAEFVKVRHLAIDPRRKYTSFAENLERLQIEGCEQFHHVAFIDDQVQDFAAKGFDLIEGTKQAHLGDRVHFVGIQIAAL